jgi:hypothetical protein
LRLRVECTFFRSRHDIAEILLISVVKHQNQIKSDIEVIIHLFKTFC